MLNYQFDRILNLFEMKHVRDKDFIWDLKLLKNQVDEESNYYVRNFCEN